jgi:CheY-like chemotaxis protein
VNLDVVIALRFFEQSGGGLGIESEPGRGTLISLWFPATANGVAPPTKVEIVAPVAPGRRALVHLVDDEPTGCELTAEGLERMGFDIAAVASSLEALARLDTGEEVNILVTDLSMPGLDGLALIREAQRRRPGLPAILLTGFATNAAELAVGRALSGPFPSFASPSSWRRLPSAFPCCLMRLMPGGIIAYSSRNIKRGYVSQPKLPCRDA